jgi:hypothetical protein
MYSSDDAGLNWVPKFEFGSLENIGFNVQDYFLDYWGSSGALNGVLRRPTFPISGQSQGLVVCGDNGEVFYVNANMGNTSRGDLTVRRKGRVTISISGTPSDGFESGWLVESLSSSSVNGSIVSLTNSSLVLENPNGNWSTSVGSQIRSVTTGSVKFLEVIGSATDLTSRSVSTSLLGVGKKYYVRVRHNSASTSSPWSGWGGFKIV